MDISLGQSITLSITVLTMGTMFLALIFKYFPPKGSIKYRRTDSNGESLTRKDLNKMESQRNYREDLKEIMDKLNDMDVEFKLFDNLSKRTHTKIDNVAYFSRENHQNSEQGLKLQEGAMRQLDAIGKILKDFSN